MLLGTLGASLLGNMLAGKGTGEGTARVGYGSKKYSPQPPPKKKIFFDSTTSFEKL